MGGMPLSRKPVLFATIGSFLVVALFAAMIVLLLRGPGSFAQVGGPFQLIDHTGAQRSDVEFRGRWMLIYFGYTYCPDLCPTALNDMSMALQEIGTRAKSVQPIFITVDPTRDTPKKLEAYIAHFHPRLIALTGDESEINRVARSYRVHYVHLRDPDPDIGYQVEHNSIIYLMGPDGRYVTHFNHEVEFEEIAKALRKAVPADRARQRSP